MNRLCVLLPILLLPPLVGVVIAGCRTSEIESCWAATAVEIDGDITDWQDRPTFFFEKESVVLSVCNDAEKLYIHFRTRDPKWARIIRMTGLTLYLDPEGKRSQNFSLRFNGGPFLSEPSDARDATDASVGKDHQRSRWMMDETAGPWLTCHIKDRIVEKLIPLDGSEGPSAAFDTSHGFYSYELSVPLAAGAVRYYGLGAVPGQTIGIGMIWGEMDDLRKRRSGPAGGGHPPGGIGGDGPGAGRFGGGRGGPPGGGRNRSEKQEVWVKTVLKWPPHDAEGR